ncbi:MAG TPA: DinB family protein [Gemmatimonadales bacterium]|nr:DinB family protein [Gemmatimonadales bacterium]
MALDARITLALLCVLPVAARAQAASPVADALREYEQRSAKNLVAAMETMPADKYGYKPTPAQMSVAQIALHLAHGNDFFCSTISGAPAPKRDSITASAPKEQLIARLRETFDFCGSALAKLDDSGLSEELPFFGGSKRTRASIILLTATDWEDHYSQMANYLRLNGLLPPTAKKG